MLTQSETALKPIPTHIAAAPAGGLQVLTCVVDAPVQVVVKGWRAGLSWSLMIVATTACTARGLIRVEDWRAGIGRCRATFPAPSTSNAACGFPALLPQCRR